ncbi:MAG: LytTR family DNA-binding domain-containing protein [Candidatus Eisenbacteria bacterium]
MRVVVVDDEPMARAKLCRLLREQPGVEVVAEAGDATAALEAVRTHEPDLIFVDVDMPGQTGFDLVAALDGPRPPCVVFATAHAEFALRAFEVAALDYLLKPFDSERVARAVARAVDRQRERGAVHLEQVQAALARVAVRSGPGGGHAQRLLVQDGGEHRLLRVADIDWVGAADNYCEIHCAGRMYLVRETLSSVEQRLDPAQFIRIHRGALVNLDRIASIRTQTLGAPEVVLQDATVLPVGRAWRAGLMRRWHGPGADTP